VIIRAEEHFRVLMTISKATGQFLEDAFDFRANADPDLSGI
jgi:hypothetical protein